jgi:dTDP-4-dehydrorhamnose reductase
MRILITGSNGLLGQKIVYQLLNAKEVFLATSLGVNRNDACPTDHYCSMDITNQVDI